MSNSTQLLYTRLGGSASTAHSTTGNGLDNSLGNSNGQKGNRMNVYIYEREMSDVVLREVRVPNCINHYPLFNREEVLTVADKS